MRIVIDYEKCIGCGLCYILLKEIFSLDDDGYCIVKKENIEKKDLKPVKKVVKACPTKVISIQKEI